MPVSALKTPAYRATQIWFPLSFNVRLLITKEPLICWLRPKGSRPPCFFQLMTGCGPPVALQFKINIPPTHSTTLAGGLTVNRGGETTTKRVFFFQRVLTGLMLNRRRSQSHLLMPCCCTSLFPGVMDRMTFSRRQLVQDTQSRDRI